VSPVQRIRKKYSPSVQQQGCQLGCGIYARDEATRFSGQLASRSNEIRRGRRRLLGAIGRMNFISRARRGASNAAGVVQALATRDGSPCQRAGMDYRCRGIRGTDASGRLKCELVADGIRDIPAQNIHYQDDGSSRELNN
jgi:hypothetical protein